MDRQTARRFFWGIAVIGCGALFLLQQLGQINFGLGDLIRNFWPLILVVIGIEGILFERKAWWSWIILALGGYFLARNLGIVQFSIGHAIRYLIPVAIIVVGISIIMKPKRSQQAEGNEEWKAYGPHYGSSDNDRPIPPAPPLHPDPTRPRKEGEEPWAPQPNGEAEWNAGSQGHDDTGERDYKDRYKSYKRQYKDYKRAYKNKHSCSNSWSSWTGMGDDVDYRSSFIGDIHVGNDYFELKPMNISHFIGDTVIDLTKAQIPYGETKIDVSSFIGDVKVFVPNDHEVGIQVGVNAFIGDTKVFDRKEDGFLKSIKVESPFYHETDKKVLLTVSTFIGDVRVTKVG